MPGGESEDLHPAPGMPLHAHHGAHEGGLAAAARSDKDHERAALDAQGNVVEHLEAAPLHVQALDLQGVATIIHHVMNYAGRFVASQGVVVGALVRGLPARLAPQASSVSRAVICSCGKPNRCHRITGPTRAATSSMEALASGSTLTP